MSSTIDVNPHGGIARGSTYPSTGPALSPEVHPCHVLPDLCDLTRCVELKELAQGPDGTCPRARIRSASA